MLIAGPAIIRWDRIAFYPMLAVELIGLAVGIVRWKELARGPRLMTLWLGAGGLFDLAAFAAAHWLHNSQVTAKVWYPVSVVLATCAMGALLRDRARVFLAVIAAAYVALWVALLFSAVETMTGYSRYLSPLHALILLIAGLMTLHSRVSRARDDLFIDQGFLLATGLVGYAAPSALQGPVLQLFIHDHPQTVLTYFGLRSALATLAMLVMTRALFIPSAPAATLPR